MGILESIKELESKIDKEIDRTKQLMEENGQLKEQVAVYQKQIEGLEERISAYAQEKYAIEDGILSVLNRLNQFEDAVEKKLVPVSTSLESAGSEEAVKREDKPSVEGEAPAADSESQANSDQPKRIQ